MPPTDPLKFLDSFLCTTTSIFISYLSKLYFQNMVDCRLLIPRYYIILYNIIVCLTRATPRASQKVLTAHLLPRVGYE